MYIDTKNKKYEVANYITDSGDSIFALPIEEATGGHIYVSEDKIRDIVQDELAKRFGPL